MTTHRSADDGPSPDPQGGAGDQRLVHLLEDLEGRASAAMALDREPEIADRSRSEYAAVTLASRLAASVGADVGLEVTGVGLVEGTLVRVADGWCQVRGSSQDWLVLLPAITIVRGASTRSRPEITWSAAERLGPGSALRRLAGEGRRCVLRLRDGGSHEIVVGRVGADFVEASVRGGSPDAGRLLVRIGGLAAVQVRDEG